MCDLPDRRRGRPGGHYSHQTGPSVDTITDRPSVLPVDNSAGRRYSESALKISEDAKTLWCRMWGDRSLGAYQHARARGNLEEPKWPDKIFRELLRTAFENRIIDRPDHPVIRELSGDL